jgi:RNA polymerase sigma-70 factor (ECF subfamily)
VSDSDEAVLLARAREGDASAFQLLLGPVIPSLRRLAFAFTGNWDEADDLAQETLVKAFRGLDSFSARSALSTWIYAVGRSVCRDWYRSRSARQRRDTQQLRESLPAAALQQEETLVELERSHELWESVQSLEPEFRTTLVLCDVEGLSYAEVADILGVPVGTVRSRLSRARGRLRKLLVREHPSMLPREFRVPESSPPGGLR